MPSSQMPESVSNFLQKVPKFFRSRSMKEFGRFLLFYVCTTILVIVVAMAVVFFGSGCDSGHSRFAGDISTKANIEYRTNPDGTSTTIITTDLGKKAQSETSVRAPDNAKEASTLMAGMDGSSLLSGASYQEIENYAKQNYKYFYLAGIGLIVAALIIATYFKNIPFGIAFAIGGVLTAMLPNIIDKLTVPVSVTLYIVVFGSAALWIWARRGILKKYLLSEKEHQKTNEVTTALVAAGKPEAATEARAALDPDYKDKLVSAAAKLAYTTPIVIASPNPAPPGPIPNGPPAPPPADGGEDTFRPAPGER